MENKTNLEQQQPAENLQAAQIGNASNPSPQADEARPEGGQLLPKEAEKYLREVASIEDEPDAADQKEMDETLQTQSRNNE